MHCKILALSYDIENTYYVQIISIDIPIYIYRSNNSEYSLARIIEKRQSKAFDELNSNEVYIFLRIQTWLCSPKEEKLKNFVIKTL